MKNKELLNTKEAAHHLGVSTSTVYRMVNRGTLMPSKTPGGQRRFSIEMLNDYLEKSKDIKAPQIPVSYKNKEKNKEENEKDPKEEKKKQVDKRNKLNNLTGTEWLPATKSYFYQKGLGSKHPHAQIERQHPAPFSFQDVENLILFFTKKGMNVLDPFGGVGSTAKACALNDRVCTSIELQKKWNDLAIERLETEVGRGTSDNHVFIVGDSKKVLTTMESNSIDFMVTSPPYWMILNKKADHKVKKERVANNLATNYSENDDEDLANIEDYDEFLNILVDGIFLECARILKQKKYMCLIVSDFRHKSEYVSFHSDLIQKLNNRKTSDGKILKLQGTKILIQNHKSLLPYGYPYAYVENIHHQYVLIFRKY
ncbi:MAG TPA: helix-turn-helix domain-containing protein [Gallicola sp.]|jgi:excisionase family DNA binding protein|nr:helix-turn-helix domain-containing protein [Gallicola sp.]